jgi:hypothetical protein
LEPDKKLVPPKRKIKDTGLPALKAKYNGRSALMETLIPVPSEGKIRKMFNNYKSPQLNKLPKVRGLNKSKSTSVFAKSFKTHGGRSKFYVPK